MSALDSFDKGCGVCAGPTSAPILHLHLLRRCNLECLHCYSGSGPSHREQLELGDACAAISLAASWGYSTLAISGGEPLLYRRLDAVIGHARELGMTVSVVTNGLLLRRGDSMLNVLRGADSMCVSVDGLEEQHDLVRAREGASRATLEAISRIADAGIPFAIACGVHKGNLDDLEGVVEMAADRGAIGVSFHAIERAGRAVERMSHQILDDEERALLFIASHVLGAQMVGRLQVRCDLTHRDRVLSAPRLVYAEGTAEKAGSKAQELGVLVLEPDGTLVPVCHGFDRRFAVGDLTAANLDPERVWDRFAASALPQLSQMGEAILARLCAEDSPIVINPSELLSELSHRWGRVGCVMREEIRDAGQS